MVLITVSCTTSQTSIHSSSGTLSMRSNPLNLFSLPLYNLTVCIRFIPFFFFFPLSRAGSSLLQGLFPGCDKWGLLSSCQGLLCSSISWTFHCSGFSCRGALALEHRLNSCSPGFIAPWHVGPSWIRDQTHVSLHW